MIPSPTSPSPPPTPGKTRPPGKRRKPPNGIAWCFFGKLAEIAGQYLKKGRQVYIEGALRTRKWTDKEGQERYTTEIVANEMKMLGSREGMSDAPARDSAGGSGGGGNRPAAAPAAQPAGGNFNDFEDDIPF